MINVTKTYLPNKEISQKRKDVYLRYKKELEGLVQFQVQNPHSTQNYGYFPIILKDEDKTLKIQKALNKIDDQMNIINIIKE